MGIILPTSHEGEETGDLEFGDKVTQLQSTEPVSR